MLKLIKPNLKYKNKYIEMIDEWKKYGEPYSPCIIEYDCNNLNEELNYNAVIEVVNNYSNGKIYDYDLDYFTSSDFYFIVDDNELIGMCELRHKLSDLGKQIKGNINCGIRPSKRNKGYCQKTIKELIRKLNGEKEHAAYMCFNEEDIIMTKIANLLGFHLVKTVQLDNKKISSYIKEI